MRSAISILLLATLATGGCDRQSQPVQQANARSGKASAPPAAGAVDRSHKGEAAPDLGFTDIDGTKRTLADFRGKPVLLNLWATWCAPCVKEMPTLDAIAVEKGDALYVIAISQDFDGAAKVTPYFEQAKFKALKPYLDTETAFSSGMGLNLPTTILFDSQGKEIWRVSGDKDWNSAEAKALVAEAG